MGADSNDRDFCSHCGRRVGGVRPHWGRRLYFLVGVALVWMLVVGSQLLGWLLIMTAPVLAVAGMALGPLYHEAFKPPTCPDCGRLVAAAR